MTARLPSRRRRGRRDPLITTVDLLGYLAAACCSALVALLIWWATG